MEPRIRKRVRNWALMVIGEKNADRFFSTPFEDIGFGYDVFGGERESALALYASCLALYRQYFHVESGGIENIGTGGRVILASNRGGPVPIEPLMVLVDMIINHSPPRFIRIPAPPSLTRLPYMGLMFQRMGHVISNPRNFELVLEREEILFMQPEERRRSVKSYLKKQGLSTLGGPFIELCLKFHAPIVPVAIFSSEQYLPFVGNVKPLAEKLHLSKLPLELNLPLFALLRTLPLPTKLKIRYGEPINFFEEYPAETVEHPNLVAQMAEVVRERIQEMTIESV